jgi:hypothetical protein
MTDGNTRASITAALDNTMAASWTKTVGRLSPMAFEQDCAMVIVRYT